MYFASFVEEYWPGQKSGTSMGRVEVYKNDDQYASEEIRWATSKVERFHEFRDRWDFREITEYHLAWMRKFIEENFFGE